MPRVRASHRILIVGAGGREHALAWRLARDSDVERVIVAPGNDGIARSVPRAIPCFPVPENDAAALLALCRAESVTLAVIGPEAPLAAGLADALTAGGVAVFGPSAAAARLEASKWMGKRLMQEAGVPTARAQRFDALPAALSALETFGPPWVVKADGLAAGKGVLVTRERDEAEGFLRACLEGERFGVAGRQVVLEEFLAGDEASVMALCDGERFILLPAARDYKRAYDGDRGPNTGGMGAFAPYAAVNAALEGEVGERILEPVLASMARRGTPYRGALYVGLMLTGEGPRVVEFNCRFGDPETQAVLPLVGGSLARLMAGAAAGQLEADRVTRQPGAVVSVAVVDEGYPELVRGGGALEGLEGLMARDDLMVFHGGTARTDHGWVVRGGRALHLAARGTSLAEARARVYAALGTLGGGGWRHRSDIGAAPQSWAATAAEARGPMCRS